MSWYALAGMAARPVSAQQGLRALRMEADDGELESGAAAAPW
jgi:hypothetical protein